MFSDGHGVEEGVRMGLMISIVQINTLLLFQQVRSRL